MFAMVPYTLKWVVPLEEVLIKKQRGLEKMKQEAKPDSDSHNEQESIAATRRMFDQWVTLNYGRMVLPFVGVMIAWTLL